MTPPRELVSLERAKIFLADQYDPDEIVDLLNLSAMDLLDAFEDRVLEYANGSSLRREEVQEYNESLMVDNIYIDSYDDDEDDDND